MTQDAAVEAERKSAEWHRLHRQAKAITAWLATTNPGETVSLSIWANVGGCPQGMGIVLRDFAPFAHAAVGEVLERVREQLEQRMAAL